MKLIRTLSLLATLSVGLPVSWGTVTINIAAEVLRDSVGTAIPTDALVLLVASSADSSFSTATAGASALDVGSYVNGSDDVVLWRGNLTMGDVGTLFESASVDFTSLSNPVALYWFPTLSLTSFGLVGGERYGMFTDSIGHNSSDPWLMPTDGSAVSFNFLTAGATILGSGGFFNDNTGLASLTATAVPEPATYAAILGFVTLGLVSYRRFRRR